MTILMMMMMMAAILRTILMMRIMMAVILRTILMMMMAAILEMMMNHLSLPPIRGWSLNLPHSNIQ